MKLAVLSYSHHRRRIGRTARDLGHEIVGVMDGEEMADRQGNQQRPRRERLLDAARQVFR